MLIKLTGRDADAWRGAFYFNADKIVTIDEIDIGNGQVGSSIYHEPCDSFGQLSTTEVIDTPDEIAKLCAHPFYAVHSEGVR